MRFLPLNQVLHVVRLEDVLDEVVKSVRADEPLGRSRVYEDAIDFVALDEVEGVKGLTLDRVPGVVDAASGRRRPCRRRRRPVS